MKMKPKEKADNKKIFLFAGLMAVTLFLSACSGSACYLSDTRRSSAQLVKTTLPASYKGRNARGLYLSISKRASLNIDVECIVDYVQGQPSIIDKGAAIENNNPWIFWNWVF